MKLQGRAVAVIAIATAALCLGFAGLVAWRVERALGGSERELAARDKLPVEVRTLGAMPNPGFEGISAPAVFKSGAALDGHFYLAGPAGLFAYSADGALEHIYRVGIDLPAAPLGPMAVGTLADSRQPELLIATGGEGVLAFNGRAFRQIRPEAAEARQVTAVLPLTSGRLLIGTAKRGLLAYDGKSLRRFHSTTDGVYVTALAGTEADLWVGTLNDGVLHWRGGQTERIGEEQGLPDARVEAIALAGDSVYVATPVGVAELRQGKVARVLAKGVYAHALDVDGGSLLIGQVEAGVLRVPLAARSEGAGLRRPIVASGAEAALRRGTDGVTVDQFFAVAGREYAVADEGLLQQEAGGGWGKALSGREALLTDRDVSALTVGSDGRLWVGYFDRGLDVIPAGGGAAVHVENEHIFCVNRIVEDAKHDTVAVATANGLVMFDRDGKQEQVLTRDAGLIANHVTDVALFGDGMVAGTPAGITFLDKSGAHSMYAFQGLVNNHVYALGVNGNQLLVGTLGGLSLVSEGAVLRNATTATSGIKHNWITGLVRLGDEWLVGTYGAGVLRMASDGSVSSTDATRTGVVVNPNAMLADGRLVLAGTLGQGLLVGDATGTRWKTVTAGLPSLNVTALAAANGVVYVGTENGLVKISEGNL